MALSLFTSLLLLYTLDSFVAVVAVVVAVVAVTIKHMQHAASAAGFAPTVSCLLDKSCSAPSAFRCLPQHTYTYMCMCTYTCMCRCRCMCEWVCCFNGADSYAKQNNDNVAC